MGRFEKQGGQTVYRQADGEVTARFDSDEEKMELSHAGSRGYRVAFLVAVALGAGYLALVFIWN